MKYEYKGVTGNTEIEVDETWSAALLELDRLENNNDQTETRRHASLEAFNLDGTLLPSDEDVPLEYELKERDAALIEAIRQLSTDQQALIKQVFFEGIAPSEIAKREGVGKSAISNRLDRAYKQLKKLLN